MDAHGTLATWWLHFQVSPSPAMCKLILAALQIVPFKFLPVFKKRHLYKWNHIVCRVYFWYFQEKLNLCNSSIELHEVSKLSKLISDLLPDSTTKYLSILLLMPLDIWVLIHSRLPWVILLYIPHNHLSAKCMLLFLSL